MRNTTLDELVEQLRAECRLSTDSSRGVESRSMLVQVINRTYEVLFDDYDWSFLKLKREDCFKQLYAGQRYYNCPVESDVDSLTRAWINYGNVWVPLEYGIDFSHYSQMDSEQDQRADPAQCWVVRDDGQFEVWPIPASNDNRIGFEGKRKFSRLSAGSDRCVLDDSLVVLFAAAEILAGNKQPDAPMKLQMAQARLAKLRASAAGQSRSTVGRGDRQDDIRGWPRIRAVWNNMTE
jgi:hypothetical protein